MTVVSTEADSASSQTSAPYVVVSCDTHIGPRLVEDLRPVLPLRTCSGSSTSTPVSSRRAGKRPLPRRAGCPSAARRWATTGGVRLDNLQTPGHFDIHQRTADLDGDGVAAEVMFHDSQNGEPIPFQTDTLLMRGANITQDFDLLRAGQRIYNQWLADACSIEPERHIGLMHLPMWDIDAAIEELEWARSVGLKGINFPTPKPFLEPYNSPSWDPFFSACEDLDVTLCNHGGAGASGGTFPGAMSIAKFEISMMARICPMDQLIFGGVFERHPRLKLVLTESPGAWWNFVLKEMDSIYLTDTRSYGPVGEGAGAAPAERVRRRAGVHRRQLPRPLRGRGRHAQRLRGPGHLGLGLPALRGHVPVRRRRTQRRADDLGVVALPLRRPPGREGPSVPGQERDEGLRPRLRRAHQGRGADQRPRPTTTSTASRSPSVRRAPGTSPSAPSGSGPRPGRTRRQGLRWRTASRSSDTAASWWSRSTARSA